MSLSHVQDNILDSEKNDIVLLWKYWSVLEAEADAAGNDPESIREDKKRVERIMVYALYSKGVEINNLRPEDRDLIRKFLEKHLTRGIKDVRGIQDVVAKVQRTHYLHTPGINISPTNIITYMEQIDLQELVKIIKEIGVVDATVKRWIDAKKRWW